MDKVFQTIRASFCTNGIYTPGILARMSGTSSQTALEALRKLAGEGSLYFEGRGRFRVTPFGPLAEGRSFFVHGAN